MKRKEMIKQVKEILDGVPLKMENPLCKKYNFIETHNMFIIQFGEKGCYMVNIYEDKQYQFYIDDETYNKYLNDEQRQKLYKVITEYCSTPVKKREEEPQYQYYVPSVQGLEVSSGQKDNLFLNYDTGTEKWVFSNNNNSCGFQTIFTDEELKELGLDPQELREKYDWVRVN